MAAVAAVPGLPGTSQMGVYPGLRPLDDLAAPGPALTDSGVGVYPALTAPEGLVFPGPAAVRSAARYAAARGGKVAFAVADGRGAVAGVDMDRAFPSASLSKAMVLVAFLRRAERRQHPTDRGRAREPGLHDPAVRQRVRRLDLRQGRARPDARAGARGRNAPLLHRHAAGRGRA